MGDGEERSAAELIGTTLGGRYEIKSLLGTGGMGAVYLARDLELDQLVAVKILASTSLEPGALERFKREVVMARKVTHPNAARTFDLGTVGTTRFLTMEYVGGETLTRRLEQGPLDVETALDVASQLCAGLQAAHAAGVVHRDLKPDNVLIEESGRAVITDFGIARPVSRDEALSSHGLVGTPVYMAPEQLLGIAVDERTDIYAFGLVLYEILTGTRPFEGDTPFARVTSRLSQPPDDPRSRRPVPDALATVILRCLEREPDARPAKIELISASLAAFEPETTELSETVSANVTATLSNPFANLPRSVPRLLVAPLKSSEDDAYFGDAITEELVDVLSMTSGLTIATASSNDALVDQARARGAATIVSGTLRRDGDRVRLAMRLIDVATEQHVWNARFDATTASVLEIQDTIAHQVAEALRVELVGLAHRGEASAPAIELYLRGRHHMVRDRFREPKLAVDALEEAMKLAPAFTPAIAAHAVACTQAWFIFAADSDFDWGRASRRAVDRALSEASHLAESHLAAGVLATNEGDLRRAVHALAHALEIAPTYAQAHDYLGRLQCEAGRAAEGVKRLELAVMLEPDNGVTWYQLAMIKALDGDIEGHRQILKTLYKIDPNSVQALAADLRSSTWVGDLERVRSICRRIPTEGPVHLHIMRLYGAAALGDAKPAQLTSLLGAVGGANPRQETTALQFGCEIALLLKDLDLSAELLLRCARLVLIDLHWLDHCPLLDPIRERAELEHARALVVQRTDAIWAESPPHTLS